MNKEEKARFVFNRFEFKPKVSFSNFKKAFIHKSFYQSSDEHGNSRYIFLGQFGFRGYIAELCFRYIAGEGTQLQHFLGNIFKNEKLEQMYDALNLGEIISYGQGFEAEKHKHIFAFAFLGFIHEHGTDNQRYAIAYRFFLQDAEQHLPKTEGQNLLRILHFKAQMLLQTKVKLLHTETVDEQYTTTIYLKSTNEAIAQHTSKSQQYAKTKAVKLALRYLHELEQSTENYQIFIEKEKQRKQAEFLKKKAMKQVAHEQRQTEKQQRKDERIAQRKEEARLRDKKRYQNKAKAKATQQKLSKQELKAKAEKELAGLSANKRRHLQDKAK